jgi:hypothetical protein
VTVVTVGQVDTDLTGSLHLEAVHSLTSLGNIDQIVVLHIQFSPFAFFGRKHFPKKAFSVP